MCRRRLVALALAIATCAQPWPPEEPWPVVAAADRAEDERKLRLRASAQPSAADIAEDERKLRLAASNP